MNIDTHQLTATMTTREGVSTLEIMRASFHPEYDVLDVFIKGSAEDTNARYDVAFSEDIMNSGKLIFSAGDKRIGRIKNGVLHVRVYEDERR